jgi:hypothetical protein
MLLNYPALAQALTIPNFQEHPRGSACRKPTHFSWGLCVDETLQDRMKDTIMWVVLRIFPYTTALFAQ